MKGAMSQKVEVQALDDVKCLRQQRQAQDSEEGFVACEAAKRKLLAKQGIKMADSDEDDSADAGLC